MGVHVDVEVIELLQECLKWRKLNETALVIPDSCCPLVCGRAIAEMLENLNNFYTITF